MRKYIFVTGGVCSSLGKGVTAASIGCLLEHRGYKVTMIKIDPYINVDAGTMSPYQHGEVFVTDDGTEADLDLGNYTRFTTSMPSKLNSITTGQVYQAVINKEREGKYLGKCVQVVPHITDEIKRRILLPGEADGSDFTIVEVGGTVGDIESVPYLEAVRQVIHEKGHVDAITVHLTLFPQVTSGEVKTKPTQHSIKEIREIGIQPDILLCRAEEPVSDSMRRKVALLTNIDYNYIFSANSVSSTIYELPGIFYQQKLDEKLCERVEVEPKKSSIESWNKKIGHYVSSSESVTIGMVGKYIKLSDAYKSIDEALIHGAINSKVKLNLVKIDSESIKPDSPERESLGQLDGMVVPGGFDSRGVDGMLEAARFAREQGIPYLGICLGMQVMVIEFCRNVLGIEEADSGEFRPDGPASVITLLEQQVDVTAYGGTMRLGGSETELIEGTKIYKAYRKTHIKERHRHRYEVANDYRATLQEKGLEIVGVTPDNALVEAVEWRDHLWGVGVQFHPEFTSRPLTPGPLFKEFIAASLTYRRGD